MRARASPQREGEEREQPEGGLGGQVDGNDQRAQSGGQLGRAAQDLHIRPRVRRRLQAARHLQPDRSAHRRGGARGLQRHRVRLRSDGHGQDVHDGGCARQARAARHHSQLVRSHFRPHCQSRWRHQVIVVFKFTI